MRLLLERPLPVSAASGLVRLGAASYVIADDELSLVVLPDDGPDGAVRLLPGALPEAPSERKRHKPDLEALCRWPAGGDALLALGSGSTAARHRGCLVIPVPEDMSKTTVEPIDLSPLHAHLAAHLPALNLEGAAAIGDVLYLVQRGNGRGNRSALVELDAAAVARALADRAPWTGDLVRAIHPIDLPERAGAPLAFTDISPLPDGSLVFVAAAEDTPDTYQDGLLTGVAVGRLAPDRALQWLVDLPADQLLKFEGIDAELAGPVLRLRLVADPDDRAVQAPLYTTTLDPLTGLAVGVTRTVLLDLSVLVDIDEAELARETGESFGEITRISDRLIAAVNNLIPGGWQSLRQHVLDPGRVNCGRCVECDRWVTDRDKPDHLPGLCNGATHEGRLLCDDHLPPDHRWAF